MRRVQNLVGVLNLSFGFARIREVKPHQHRHNQQEQRRSEHHCDAREMTRTGEVAAEQTNSDTHAPERDQAPNIGGSCDSKTESRLREKIAIDQKIGGGCEQRRAAASQVGGGNYGQQRDQQWNRQDGTGIQRRLRAYTGQHRQSGQNVAADFKGPQSQTLLIQCRRLAHASARRPRWTGTACCPCAWA